MIALPHVPSDVLWALSLVLSSVIVFAFQFYWR